MNRKRLKFGVKKLERGQSESKETKIPSLVKYSVRSV